jgi:C-terminal processing protease CtpA/Prc
MLRANAAAGKYDGLTGDAEFAKQVTADIQAISFDGHLKLVPVQKPAGASGGGSRRGIPETIEAQARLGDVAYIRLAKFFGEPEEVAAVEKFVTDNIDAKTMILDVRTHIGGGLDEMDAIFPYLFDKETVLVGMDTRLNVNSPLDDGPRVRRVASPQGVVRRVHFVVPKAGSPLAKARVFVLASGRTGSAGEHFVLSLKRTGRATVVGETTYGAGNFGSTEQIAGGFQAFIPVGRTFDPDTDKGWDYFGIAPNIAVPAEQALVEALVRSGVARDQAEIFSAKYGPAAADVTSTRKAPASVAGI